MSSRFCIDGFWNTQFFNNPNYPIFTECFQYSLLLIPSCLFMSMYFLWLSLRRYISLPKIVTVPCDHWYALKLMYQAMLAILLFLEIILETIYIKKIDNLDILYVLSYTALFTSLLLTITLTEFLRRLRHPISTTLFIFWLSSTLAYLIRFFSNVCRLAPREDEYTSVGILCVSTVIMTFLIISLVTDCFPRYTVLRSVLKKRTPCPEEYASIISRLTFSWLDRYIYRWYRRDITDETAFDLGEDYESKKNTDYVERIFLAKVDQQKEKSCQQSVIFAEEAKPLTSKKSEEDSRNPGWTLSISLMKVFFCQLFRASCIKTIQDVIQFSMPFLLKLLLQYIKDANSPPWKGYCLASLFLIAGCASTIAQNKCLYITGNVSIKIRAALIGMVYRKTLRLSNEVRGESESGGIVNLMSVDIERIMLFITYSWYIVSAPLQIVLALAFLYTELGVSALTGIGVLLLFFPLNYVVMKFIQKASEVELKWKDKRVKILTEILGGIKLLKMYVWESSFKSKVTKIRDQEVKYIGRVSVGWGIFSAFWDTAPFLVMLLTLVVYVYSDQTHIITAENAFVSLTLFNMIRLPMNILPWGLSQTVNAFVSLKRIERYLVGADADMTGIEYLKDPRGDKSPDDTVIDIRQGTFSWRKDSEAILRGIDMEVKRGRLVAVVGKVGVGKSSLLSALLGEMVRKEGSVMVKGSIAYVPQEAWIQNKSLKENIFFGKGRDIGLYDKVVEACCLTTDLDQLPARDETEIGERGINLSGGQKQRVSLARAIYQDRDIYLLDDPLSAVDAHVGHDLFENVISNKGMLGSKTRILVTHGLQWLPRVDEVIVMDADGHISERGPFKEILHGGDEFRRFVEDHKQENLVTIDSSIPVTTIEPQSDRLFDIPVEDVPAEDFIRMVPKDQRRSRHSTGTSGRMSMDNTDPYLEGSKYRKQVSGTMNIGRINEEELVMTGSVSWRTYRWYIVSRGSVIFGLSILAYVVFASLAVYSNIWLNKFTSDPDILNASSSIARNYSFKDPLLRMIRSKNDYYMTVYALIGLGQLLVIFLYVAGFTLGNINSSRRLHVKLLGAILRSPMSFFDTTPSGRTLNRFSKDMDMIDHTVTMTLSDSICCFLIIISSIVVIVIVTPWFLAAFVPLFILYYLLQLFFMPTSRQSRRLDSIANSPIFNHFAETLQGCAVIRAFSEQKTFQRTNQSLVDKSSKFKFIQCASLRWFCLRLDLLSDILVFLAVVFAVWGRSNLSASLVGLSISYALQISSVLNWAFRQYTELETNAVAIERVREFSRIPSEAPSKSIIPLKRDWPAKGNISFENLKLQYRPGLPVVLDGIDLHLEGGQRIGVVGRTGAGKSSLTLALFRLVEPMEGTILIDGVDIRSLGLDDLRRGLTILPQDPVIFSGTLRENLDPFEKHSEKEILESLERAHLSEWMCSQEEGLEYECGEGGTNLSTGQKQLLCLARAILRRSKVLILDEATASVDVETDRLVMQTVRQQFSGSTVMIIAHRINTILDTDKVVVLDQGRVVEYGSPEELLLKSDGIFKGLLEHSSRQDDQE